MLLHRIGLRPTPPSVVDYIAPSVTKWGVMLKTPPPILTASPQGATPQGLLNQITVQETAFFRHPEHFEVGRDVLPLSLRR
jgi:hypothetical protein